MCFSSLGFWRWRSPYAQPQLVWRLKHQLAEKNRESLSLDLSNACIYTVIDYSISGAAKIEYGIRFSEVQVSTVRFNELEKSKRNLISNLFNSSNLSRIVSLYFFYFNCTRF